MTLVTVSLTIVMLLQYTTLVEGFSFRSLQFGMKKMSKEDYKKTIYVRLLREGWKPQGANVPGTDEVLPKYSGTTREAFEIFLNKDNMFKYHESSLEHANDIMKQEYGYNRKLESIFIINVAKPGSFDTQNTITALSLRNLTKKYNVFAFYLHGLKKKMIMTILKTFFGLKGYFKDIGEAVGDFFIDGINQNLIRHDQIHLVSICFTSQLSAYISRYISSKIDNQKIKSIVALDPLAIGLFGRLNKVLSKDDAEVVHAYHTNSVVAGSLYRTATADFNFNGGHFQPGCFPFTSFTSILGTKYSCSHHRVIMLFWYVILFPDLWQARRCDSWHLFKTCQCNDKEITYLTFPPSPGPRGMFYLNTMSHKPYGYGLSGASCSTVFKFLQNFLREGKKTT